nr:uncharacterized protein LOC109146501 [Ipomoea trifida]
MPELHRTAPGKIGELDADVCRAEGGDGLVIAADALRYGLTEEGVPPVSPAALPRCVLLAPIGERSVAATLCYLAPPKTEEGSRHVAVAGGGPKMPGLHRTAPGKTGELDADVCRAEGGDGLVIAADALRYGLTEEGVPPVSPAALPRCVLLAPIGERSVAATLRYLAPPKTEEGSRHVAVAHQRRRGVGRRGDATPLLTIREMEKALDVVLPSIFSWSPELLLRCRYHLLRICQNERVLLPSIEPKIVPEDVCVTEELDPEEHPEVFWMEEIRGDGGSTSKATEGAKGKAVSGVAGEAGGVSPKESSARNSGIPHSRSHNRGSEEILLSLREVVEASLPSPHRKEWGEGPRGYPPPHDHREQVSAGGAFLAEPARLNEESAVKEDQRHLSSSLQVV